MTKSKFLFFGILSFFALIILSSFVVAYGTSFENAELIGPGTYEGSGFEVKDPPAYYKINLPSGTEYKMIMTSEGTYNNCMNFNLYDLNRKKLAGGDCENSGALLRWGGYAEQESSEYYLVLNSGSDGVGDWYYTKNFRLVVEERDVGDAGLGIDVGANFEDALLVEPGTIEGTVIAGCCGNDEKDMYKIDLKKNQNLSLKVTPLKLDSSTTSYPDLSAIIYGEDRRSVISSIYNGEGQIFSLNYFSPMDQTVYFAILRDSVGGKYSVEVVVKEGQPAKKETTRDVTESSPNDYDSFYPSYKNTSIWSSYFAKLGAILVVILVVLLILSIFWLWMLIDCIKREFKDKVMWIVLLLVLGPVGAIAYYFVVKRKNKN